MGRRVLRDILFPESPFATPQHDISFEELDILLTADNPDAGFRRASANFLFVEILPCVSVQINSQRRNSLVRQQEFFESEGAVTTSSELAELGQILRKAFEIFNKISAGQSEAKKRARKT
jgi:hypothetical protein